MDDHLQLGLRHFFFFELTFFSEMKEGCLEKELIFMPKPAVWLLAVAMHMVCDLLENLGAGVLCSLQNVIRVLYFFFRCLGCYVVGIMLDIWGTPWG